ncbi:hypothetical protein BH11PSE2_BH11PSE2_02880 [soil metagenome]
MSQVVEPLPKEAAAIDAGWKPLTVAALGADLPRLRTDPNAAPQLYVKDDFDGDKRPDTAILMGNQALGRYAVIIQMASGARYRVREGPLNKAAYIGVQWVSPGDHVANCSYFNADVNADIRCGQVYAEEVNFPRPAVNVYTIGAFDSTNYYVVDGKLRRIVIDK